MKKVSPSVSLVTPIYNDMRSMPTVLPQLVRLMKKSYPTGEIVLIDDMSSDSSRQWIAAYVKGKKYIRLILHGENYGIAKTYQELYKRAQGDVIVLFSLDGEWDAQDAVRLADTLIKQKLDMVIGVRKQKQYTLWRAFISSAYNILTKVLFGVQTQDAGSIKAMRKKLVNDIPILSRGVFDEAERIIKASKKGYRIGFISVSHSAAKKARRGIKLTHVTEAVVDMVRVFWNVQSKTV
jgi:glycosyltransferase involved in cell wall biosynthesis